MKDNFVIHNSLYEPIEHLSDEQLGRLFRALFQYSINSSTKVDNDIQIAFNFFKMHIDFSNEKYQEVCEKRSDAGRKGAEKRWNGKNSKNGKCYNAMANDSKNGKCYNAMANDSKAINDMAKMGRIDKNRIDKNNNTPIGLDKSNPFPPNGETAILDSENLLPKTFSKSGKAPKRKVPPKEKGVQEDLSQEWREVLETWFAYKSSRKESYKSDLSVKAFITKLKNLAENNVATAQSIIEQSMANNWAGIFALKHNDYGYKSKKDEFFETLHNGTDFTLPENQINIL